MVRAILTGLPPQRLSSHAGESNPATNALTRALAERPTPAYLAAAKAGGTHANDAYRAEFLYQNLMIEANVIHGAWRHVLRCAAPRPPRATACRIRDSSRRAGVHRPLA
ncbi:hypothetical protein [Thioalkalicoccus limnaeus]|uniref:hypothetical protein n=1 Tax=Thioalkalicoccus limnaeus TaxID=120681 RepID=UPI003F7492C7